MTDQPARVPAQASPAATAAYVRIYQEEQPRLVAYARSLTRNTWAAEDLVAEAHFRVWRRLSAGHEIDNVPAYLMTTVRHLASSVASATHETPRDPQIPEQASSGHVADPAEQVSATDLLVRVLGELPERWVRALWLADAEGQPLESVGRQIGAKQGATAVLLHRAREGMRQAFLRSQTEAPDDPACEVHWVRMPAYVRGSATPRQSERLLAHVDFCEGCRGRLAVLIRANHRLPAIVGPALLVLAVGGGGAGKVLASLTGGFGGFGGSGSFGGSGGAGGASSGGHGLLRTTRAAGPKTKAALASGTAAAAALAVVLSLGANESPATVTSPGREPVAQGPVAQGPVVGPSEGAGETPGSDRPVGRNGDRDRTDAAGAAVSEDVGGVQLVAGARSREAGEPENGSDGGGGVAEPTPPEQPAPEGPTAPGSAPPELSAPEEPTAPGAGPDPSPSPAAPAPGSEEPQSPAQPDLPANPEPPAQPDPPAEPDQPAQSEPTKPTEPPKEQQPEPEPEPEKPDPGVPVDETPVPEPTTPTPVTPDPPMYSEPPTTPEPTAPTSPEPPQPPAPSQPPTPSADPTPPTQPTPPTAPEPPSDHHCGS